MNEMLGGRDQERIARVRQAFLKMKKFDIDTLKRAYEASSNGKCSKRGQGVGEAYKVLRLHPNQATTRAVQVGDEVE